MGCRNEKLTSRFKKYGPLFLITTINSPFAHALGQFGMDASSFLKSADDHNNGALTLLVGLDLEESNAKFADAKVDLRAYTFLSDQTSFTIEALDAYIATSPRLTGEHQLSLGRRNYLWSRADQHWQMGLWSPRFIWDPVKPETVGLVGLSYQFAPKNGFNWRVYASPIAVPERGYPFKEEEGKLVSASRFWNPLPSSVDLGLGQSTATPIHYSLNLPPIMDMVARPNAAISLGYAREWGYWVNASYGYMPIHQPDITVDAFYDVSKGIVRADLYPVFRMHHLMTFESGFRQKRWQLWGSVSREIPVAESDPAQRSRVDIGASTIASVGAEVTLPLEISLQASTLNVWERPNQGKGTDLDEIELPLPTRFNYRRAYQAGLSWGGISPAQWDVKWIHDYGNQNHLISFDATYPSDAKRKQGQHWTFNVGADIVPTDNDEGFIGDLRGNDRIRGKVTYEF